MFTVQSPVCLLEDGALTLSPTKAFTQSGERPLLAQEEPPALLAPGSPQTQRVGAYPRVWAPQGCPPGPCTWPTLHAGVTVANPMTQEEIQPFPVRPEALGRRPLLRCFTWTDWRGAGLGSGTDPSLSCHRTSRDLPSARWQVLLSRLPFIASHKK